MHSDVACIQELIYSLSKYVHTGVPVTQLWDILTQLYADVRQVLVAFSGLNELTIYVLDTKDLFRVAATLDRSFRAEIMIGTFRAAIR